LAKFHGDFVDLPVVDDAVFVTIGIARSACGGRCIFPSWSGIEREPASRADGRAFKGRA
jgi:hypothetical protein